METDAERVNRAVIHQYEPGSTFKVVSMAAALEHGSIGPDEWIDCENGAFRYRGRLIRDIGRHGMLSTREVPLRSVSGPIGIAQVARNALSESPRHFIWLLGFFSLQLGILNLLPIPVLDGGHILILAVEGVIRRELSDRIKERVMQVGFVFLLAFMSVVIYLDILKSVNR